MFIHTHTRYNISERVKDLQKKKKNEYKITNVRVIARSNTVMYNNIIKMLCWQAQQYLVDGGLNYIICNTDKYIFATCMIYRSTRVI